LRKIKNAFAVLHAYGLSRMFDTFQVFFSTVIHLEVWECFFGAVE